MTQDGQLLISTWPNCDTRNRPTGSPSRNWETSSSALTGQIRPLMTGTRALHGPHSACCVIEVHCSRRSLVREKWESCAEGTSRTKLGEFFTTTGDVTNEIHTMCGFFSYFLDKTQIWIKNHTHRSFIRSYRSPQTKNSADGITSESPAVGKHLEMETFPMQHSNHISPTWWYGPKTTTRHSWSSNCWDSSTTWTDRNDPIDCDVRNPRRGMFAHGKWWYSNKSRMVGMSKKEWGKLRPVLSLNYSMFDHALHCLHM